MHNAHAQGHPASSTLFTFLACEHHMNCTALLADHAQSEPWRVRTGYLLPPHRMISTKEAYEGRQKHLLCRLNCECIEHSGKRGQQRTLHCERLSTKQSNCKLFPSSNFCALLSKTTCKVFRGKMSTLLGTLL